MRERQGEREPNDAQSGVAAEIEVGEVGVGRKARRRLSSRRRRDSRTTPRPRRDCCSVTKVAISSSGEPSSSSLRIFVGGGRRSQGIVVVDVPRQTNAAAWKLESSRCRIDRRIPGRRPRMPSATLSYGQSDGHRRRGHTKAMARANKVPCVRTSY